MIIHSHRFVIELLHWHKVCELGGDKLHRPPPLGGLKSTFVICISNLPYIHVCWNAKTFQKIIATWGPDEPVNIFQDRNIFSYCAFLRLYHFFLWDCIGDRNNEASLKSYVISNLPYLRCLAVDRHLGCLQWTPSEAKLRSEWPCAPGPALLGWVVW